MGAKRSVGGAFIRRSLVRWIALLALAMSGVYQPHPLMPFAVPAAASVAAFADFDLCAGSGNIADYTALADLDVSGDQGKKTGGLCCHCLACAHQGPASPPQNLGMVIQFPAFVACDRGTPSPNALHAGVILRVSARPRAPPISV